jgi:hypothetical protein
MGSLLMFVLIGAACGSEGTSPTTEAALPADSAGAVPTDTTTVPSDTTTAPPDSIAVPDSTLPPPADTTLPDETIITTDASAYAGITFGTYNMRDSYLSSVHTGTMLGGPLSPSNIVSVLTAVRNKGGRIVIKLCKGDEKYIKDPNGNFSLTKWKALIDQYRNVNLAPFIADGTILGHFLIDEPHRAQRWGKVISQATVESMAAYSKNIWPTMPTLVRVVPTWLAAAPVTYTHLDAGWFQHTAKKGNVNTLVAAEVAAAKRLRLGLLVGVNAMNGGDGSSRIPGLTRGDYMMSAAELRSYGTALLNQSYACAFYTWQHNTTYYARSDIKAVMAELSAKAKAHAKTSCRQ